MHDPLQRTHILQNVQRILRCLSHMNKNRFVVFLRKPDLPDKAGLLVLRLYIIPMIIQSDFTDCDKALLFQQLLQPLIIGFLKSIQIVRMKAQCDIKALRFALL